MLPMTMYPRWTIRVHHVPTGESVTMDSNHFRNQHKARDAAIKLLAARLKAKEEGLFKFR